MVQAGPSSAGGFAPSTGCHCAGQTSEESFKDGGGTCPAGTTTVVCDDSDGAKTNVVYPWMRTFLGADCGGSKYTQYAYQAGQPFYLALQTAPTCGNALSVAGAMTP